MSVSIGDWICTYMGLKFWPLDPRPENILIQDIAHALSMQCRYGGHCRRFYSVAQHSVLVSNYLKEKGYVASVQLAGLLHDAAEAYLIDMPRPIKHMPEMDDYCIFEDKIQEVIYSKYGLPEDELSSVKEADNAVLAVEMGYLMPAWIAQQFYEHRGLDYSRLESSESFLTLEPSKAEDSFLDKFHDLRDQIGG